MPCAARIPDGSLEQDSNRRDCCEVANSVCYAVSAGGSMQGSARVDAETSRACASAVFRGRRPGGRMRFSQARLVTDGGGGGGKDDAQKFFLAALPNSGTIS